MRATQAWVWHGSDDPDDLVLTEKPLPAITDNQVLVANRAVGLNPVDWKLMTRRMKVWKEGQIPGVDGMGTIVAIGAGVRHLRLGARVAYHTDLRFDGSYARHTVVAARALIPVPDYLDDTAAAAFPCPGLTAWQAMKKVPDLVGQNVLVNGAGGAVGHYLTQLLVRAGARVYVTAHERHRAFFLEKGAIAVFDYRQEEWRKDLGADLFTQPLYAVFDTVNQASALSLVSLLGYYGHIVTVQDRIAESPLEAFTTCVSLHEIALGAMHAYGSASQWHRLVAAGEELLQQIGRCEIQPPRLNVTPFEELPEALKALKHKNDGIKRVVRL